MYIDIKVSPYDIKEPKFYYVDVKQGDNPFPVMCIDVDSYIVSAKLETSLDFHVTQGVHNLQIGKYSSLAEGILFLMDVDKDYKQVYMGAMSAFQGQDFKGKMNRRRRGQIIIQNDCWIANGVTIMGGVTVHNGAIIAAASVVTKDVPPYAIVAGNPAKVIKYRLDEQQIQDLQRIAWWNWSEDKIKKKAELFHGDVSEFISEHIEEVNHELSNTPPLILTKTGDTQLTYLFMPDFYEPYPIYEKVIVEFVRYFDGKKTEMLIYIKQDNRLEVNKSKIHNILEKFADCNYSINIFSEKVEDERSLFKSADFYITTRAKENVQRMCFANLYNTKCISGVDIPVFGLENKDKATVSITNLYGGNL
jgi:virginiamycin A acetyltransferase